MLQRTQYGNINIVLYSTSTIFLFYSQEKIYYMCLGDHV